MAIGVVRDAESGAPVTKERAPKKSFLYLNDPSVSNKVDRFLRAFAAILQYSDYGSLLEAFSASAARCSRCTVTCHVYQASGDPRDIPCYRTHVLLDIYKRYFTIGGALRGHLGGDRELDDGLVDEMTELFYRCNACRRCSLECPMGLDHGLVTRLGRYILSMAGISAKALQVSVDEQLEGETRNTSKVPQAALRSTLEFLSEEFQENTGIGLDFPLDQMDRQYIFFCAVSDYLMEPDTLMGNAAVLHAAGDWDKWTIGTSYFDGINYGLFYNDWYLERIIKQLTAEVERLRAKQVLIGECGHASRSARDFIPVFGGPRPPPVQSFMEYTASCLEQGKIRLTPGVVKERVTYHDPCNIARSGWVVEQPRRILGSFVDDFVDMTPNGRMNYCCGGGGGLVSMDETKPFRMDVAGLVKADQIRATGAQIVIAPCANCKKQLKEIVEHYELPCRVLGLHDLVLQVIDLPGGTPAVERYEKARAQAE
jgi:Fe-S oxidoreductase